MRISDWSSDVCSSDLIGFDTAPPADAVEIVEQQVGAARTAMQDQGREIEAGEGTEGGGGAGAEIGLSDRTDDPAQSGDGRFHIRLSRSGEIQKHVLIQTLEHCNCRERRSDRTEESRDGKEWVRKDRQQ